MIMVYLKIKPSEWWSCLTGDPLLSRTGCSTFLQATTSLETGGKAFWAFAPGMPHNYETTQHILRNYFIPLGMRLMQRLLYVNRAQTPTSNFAGGGFHADILQACSEMGVGFLACFLDVGRDHQWWDADVLNATGGFPDLSDPKNLIVKSWLQNFDGSGRPVASQGEHGETYPPTNIDVNTFYNVCMCHAKCKIDGHTVWTGSPGTVSPCAECPLPWEKYRGYPSNTEIPRMCAAAVILDHPYILEQMKADWSRAYELWGGYSAWLGWINYMEFPERPYYGASNNYSPYSLWKYTQTEDFAKEVQGGVHLKDGTPCALLNLTPPANPEQWVATPAEQAMIPTLYSDISQYHFSGKSLEATQGWDHYVQVKTAEIVRDFMEWWISYTGKPWIWEMEAPKAQIHVETGGERFFSEMFGGTTLGGAWFCTDFAVGENYLSREPRIFHWDCMNEIKHYLHRAGTAVMPWGSWGNHTDNGGGITPPEIRLTYLMHFPLLCPPLFMWDMQSTTFAGGWGGDPSRRWICDRTSEALGFTADDQIKYPYRFGNLLNRMRFYGGFFGSEIQSCRVLAFGGADTSFSTTFFTPALDIVMDKTGRPEHGDENIINIRFPNISPTDFDAVVIWSGPGITSPDLQQKILNFINSGGGIVFLRSIPAWFPSITLTPISPDHPIWEPFTDLSQFGGQILEGALGPGRVVQVGGVPRMDRIGTPGKDDQSYNYSEMSFPPGGRPRDSAIVLITNAILYAGRKENQIPAFWYETIYKPVHWGGEVNPGRDIYYGIAGSVGNPLVWFSNATDTDEYGVNLHLSASFFGIDPTGWVMVDVANWSFARGSGEDIHINPQPLPAYSWVPIYIRSLPGDRRCAYTNAFIEKVTEDGLGNFTVPAPSEMPVWMVIRSDEKPTTVLVNGKMLSEYAELLHLTDPVRSDFPGRQVADDPNTLIGAGIEDYTFSEGWRYDAANQMLVVKFISSSTNTVQVQYVPPLFTTGYESGSFSAEGFERTVIDRGTLEILETFPHHGRYSCRAQTIYRFGNAMAVKDLPAEQQLIYVRAYVLFETEPDVTNPTTPGYANMYPIYIRHYDPARAGKPYIQYAGAFAYHKEGEPVRWCVNYSDNESEGHYSPVAATGPELNRWYCMELMVKRGAGDGEVRLFIDGEEVITVLGLYNDSLAGYSTPDINNVWLGLGEGPGTLFIDCVQISNFYVGPEPVGAGTLEIEVLEVTPETTVTVTVTRGS